MITIWKEKNQTNPCLFISKRTLPLCWVLFSSLSLSTCTRAHYVNSLARGLGCAKPFTYFSPNSSNNSRREELLSTLLWWRDCGSKRSCGHSWQNWDSNPGLIPTKLCKLVIDMIFVTVFFHSALYYRSFPMFLYSSPNYYFKEGHKISWTMIM